MKSWFGLLLLLNSVVLTGQSDGVIQFKSDPEPIKRLNSPYDENYIALHPDGNQIILTRRNHPGNVGDRHNPGDLWISNFDSTWSLPHASINIHPTKFVSPLGYVNNGEYFLYSTTHFDRGIFVGEVWICNIEDEKIVNPRKIEVDHFVNLSDHQSGSISADGKHLLLSMEGNFTFGVEDLYVSHLKSDGSWSAPKNLGYRINTSFQEYTPFLAADGKTLFFASNGHENGFGSFDLYRSERIDDTWQNWTQPENLGQAVNSRGSETSFSFLPDSDYAYFVSTQDSDGYGDIKRINIASDIESFVDSVDLFVLQEEVETRNKVFRLIDKNSGERVSGTIILTGEDYRIELTSGNGIEEMEAIDITINTKASGYLDKQVQITAAQLDDTDTLDISIDKLVVGNTIQLENVLFHRGTANFIEGSERDLDRVVSMMQEYPNIKIMIKGHTDSVGDPVLNLELSRERVNVVRDYLMDKGVDFRRLQGRGYGGNAPLVSNDTEENRQLNRRVEFTIIAN